jgi:hypothetical protein
VDFGFVGLIYAREAQDERAMFWVLVKLVLFRQFSGIFEGEGGEVHEDYEFTVMAKSVTGRSRRCLARSRNRKGRGRILRCRSLFLGCLVYFQSFLHAF